MKRHPAAALLAATACLTLAGCTTAQDTPPRPTYTTVPTTSPTPQAGVDTPLATMLDRNFGYPVYVSVYDVKAWEAEDGCDCSAPGDESTELYPAGSTAWAIRVELRTQPGYADDDGIPMSELSLDPSWGPGIPAPVVAPEGENLADGLDLGWGLESIQNPPLFAWGETRTFVTAVYVPRGAVTLDLTIEVPPTPGQRYQKTSTNTLEVPIPQPVIDLMYAHNNGD